MPVPQDMREGNSWPTEQPNVKFLLHMISESKSKDAFLEFPCFLYDPTDIGQFDISFLILTKTSLYI